MALSLRELQIQTFLANSDDGEWEYKLINAKLHNRQAFILLKQPITAERFKLTPQEELYAEFFRNEKQQVISLGDAELDDHIDELAKIAFEAKARLYAAKDEKSERRAKTKKGFTANVTSDELSSDALNAVTERQVKLNKRERMIKNLMDKVGLDRATAEAMVPDTDKMSKGRASSAVDKLKLAQDSVQAIITPTSAKATEIVNPFAPAVKKEEITTTSEINVTIIDDNTTVIKETIRHEEKEKPTQSVGFAFQNPFAK